MTGRGENHVKADTSMYCKCGIGELTSCCGGTTNPDCQYHGYCDESCEFREDS